MEQPLGASGHDLSTFFEANKDNLEEMIHLCERLEEQAEVLLVCGPEHEADYARTDALLCRVRERIISLSPGSSSANPAVADRVRRRDVAAGSDLLRSAVDYPILYPRQSLKKYRSLLNTYEEQKSMIEIHLHDAEITKEQKRQLCDALSEVEANRILLVDYMDNAASNDDDMTSDGAGSAGKADNPSDSKKAKPLDDGKMACCRCGSTDLEEKSLLHTMNGKLITRTSCTCACGNNWIVADTSRLYPGGPQVFAHAPTDGGTNAPELRTTDNKHS